MTKIVVQITLPNRPFNSRNINLSFDLLHTNSTNVLFLILDILCKRHKNSNNLYQQNNSSLKVCLESVYFVEIENFFLKIL